MEKVILFSLGFVSCASLVLVRQYLLKGKNSNSILDAIQEEVLSNEHHKDTEELLKQEQLSRGSYFFGEEKQKILESKYVVVVGMGGVGSHAAHLLARSGIKRLRIVDFDQVTLSSLNRHAVATRIDVGTSKVACLANFIRRFAPWCEVEPINLMFSKETAREVILSKGKPDYVLDCIDDVRTKIQLLHFCCLNNIKVITSCGAGAKADPTRLHITSLSDVAIDPLAARIKIELKTRLKGIKTAKNSLYELTDDEKQLNFVEMIRNIEAVYSSEKPIVKLLPLSEQALKNPSEYGIVDNFRVRIMPVLGTMPGIFGMSMAARVLTNLVEKPFLPSPLPSIKVGTADRIRVRFYLRFRKAMEKAKNQRQYNLNEFDAEDVEYVVTNLKRRCAVTFEKWQRNKTEIALWRYDRSITVGNLILVRKDVAEKLDGFVANEELPTPFKLSISSDHFNSIEAILQLLANKNSRERSSVGLVDYHFRRECS